MFEIIFAGILILFCAGEIWAFFVTKKVKKSGIETAAEVSRIEVTESADADGAVSRSFAYYVTYVNQNGETVEALLSNPKKGLEEGSRLKIRYLPEKQEYPVLIEVLQGRGQNHC